MTGPTTSSGNLEKVANIAQIFALVIAVFAYLWPNPNVGSQAFGAVVVIAYVSYLLLTVVFSIRSVKSGEPWGCWVWLRLIVLYLFTAGFFYFLGTRPVKTSDIPGISLSSMTYKVDDYDPRLVDLRKVASEGIPASPGRLLQFLDLWITVPRDASECWARAEIHQDPQRSSLIGVTEEAVPLRAGHIKLDDVKIEKYPDGRAPHAWHVQRDWEDLYLALITYCDDEEVDWTNTKIHLDANGKAWLLGPPTANFASIVYAVNGGPEQLIDLREVTEEGLGIGPGDDFALLEIWYHAPVRGGDESTIHAEAYLSPGGFDPETYKVTPMDFIEEGIHELAGSDVLSWIVPGNRKYLVLTLERSDGAILDRLVLPLSSLAATPMPTPTATPGQSPISQWCDDFNEGQIDERRWLIKADEENLIYVQNGVLNLGITAEQSPVTDSLGARIEAVTLDRPVREVAFTIALESYRGDAPAGAGPEVFLDGGQDFSVKVGPSPNGPEIEFYVCPAESCSGNYDEYLHPSTGPFPAGEQVEMRVAWRRDAIEFYVDGDLRVSYPVDQGPINRLQFGMYADPGSVFHTTVDDVCVTFLDD